MQFSDLYRFGGWGDLGSQRASGFTLIELLVVVAIISILSAIAVPNFLEAQTRAKVARMQADMRTVATALEAYAVDYNRYPPRQRFPSGSTTGRTLGDATTRAKDTSRLTTPIGYIARIPNDVFENRLAPPNNIIDFWDNTILAGGPNNRPGAWNRRYTGWLLVSVGPDEDVGRGPFNMGNFPYTSTTLSLNFDYDPTNGTISPGNIYRGTGSVSGTEAFNR